MPLDTLENVKLLLAVTTSDDDDLLEAFCRAADEFIPKYCGRSFEGGTFTETHPGGSRLLFLRNYPIEAVPAVKVDASRAFGDGTTRDPSRYVVHAERGVIESLDGPFLGSRGTRPEDFPATVEVEYDTPTDAVPPAVCKAYAELVGQWYREAKTRAAVDQHNMLAWTDEANEQTTTYPWGQSGGFQIPDSVLDLLRPYRVPTV